MHSLFNGRAEVIIDDKTIYIDESKSIPDIISNIIDEDLIKNMKSNVVCIKRYIILQNDEQKVEVEMDISWVPIDSIVRIINGDENCCYDKLILSSYYGEPEWKKQMEMIMKDS